MPVDPSEVLDLGHYLIQDAKNDKAQEAWLTGESIFAVIAGSEPMAGILTALFYELAKNPDQVDIIYHEIQHQKQQQQLDMRDARQVSRRLPHLEAALLEALRLYPAVPTGGNRKTSSEEGITVNGVFIPPETTIVAPKFCIARRTFPLVVLVQEERLIEAKTGEDCLKQADKFIPERWTTRPELVLDQSASSPFGTGK